MSEVNNNDAGNVNNAGNQNDVGTMDQNTSGASGATTEKPQEKMFTQEEVSKMMAREKHQGKNSVYNELGIDPDDTSAIQMFKAFVESQKSKEEKQAEKVAKQDEAIAEANRKLKIAETKATLMAAGVTGEYVDDATTIALAKLSADDSLDIETVAKDLKAKYAVWFGGNSGQSTDDGVGKNANDDTKKTTGQKGTGTTIGAASTSSGEGGKAAGIGARLAASRKANAGQKSSFWN